MALTPRDLAKIIKEQIKNFERKVDTSEVGKVLTIGDGIAVVYGLNEVEYGEIVQFETGDIGLAINLEEEFVSIVFLGECKQIRENTVVRRTFQVAKINVGNELLGRVVNALGQPLDGKNPLKSTEFSPIFKLAPGVMTRKSVDEPLETGIIAIDALIPIGKGQRELIIGDRQTGKTAIAIDTIINQKGKNVKCVYVAIGQKNSTLLQIISKLEACEALDYTTFVVANASDSVTLQYLAPYSGITIAEYWMSKGEDVLIIYDDLSKHAIAYRTISLLLRRPPGREAYPGDIFYLHSQLLERSARLNIQHGAGSITALPIIETQAGDISAYIPTNVISITDGQIFTKEQLFNIGQRPAVDVAFSVSRVGSAAQYKMIKQVSSKLKLELAQFNEMQAFAKFSSDLDASTKVIIDQGTRINEFLKQAQYSPLTSVEQAVLLLVIQHRLSSAIPLRQLQDFKNQLLFFLKNNQEAQKLCQQLADSLTFSDSLKNQFLKLITDFIQVFQHTNTVIDH